MSNRLYNYSSKTGTRVCVTVLCGFVLSSCATPLPPEEDPVMIKLNELEQRLVRIERVMNNDSLIELLSETQSMQMEIRELRGQVETAQHELEGAVTRQRNLYVDLDERLTELESSGVTASDLDQQIAAATGSRTVTTTDTLAGAGDALPVPNGTDDENYNAAFNLLQSGQYAQAAAGFRKFLTAFPDSIYADNAQYWLAETFYVTREFGNALAGFSAVIDQYPESRKIPDAMLKIGYCYSEQSNWKEARTVLTRVREQYPDTAAARLAGDRLNAMDNEGR